MPNVRLRGTDAEERHGGGGNDEEEEQLRAGAEVVLEQLQAARPIGEVGRDDEVVGDGGEAGPEQQIVPPLRVHRRQGDTWAPGPANVNAADLQAGEGGDQVVAEEEVEADAKTCMKEELKGEKVNGPK